MTSPVLVNGRFLGRKPTGVDRFAMETLRALDALYECGDPAVAGMCFEILVPKGLPLVHELRHIPTRAVGNLQGQAWEQFDLPLAAGGSLLVNLCNTAPLLRKNQLVVVHDAATSRAPASYSTAFRLWYGLMIPAVYRRAASICTVSQFAKDDLAALHGARQDVAVLPEGTEHMGRTRPDTGVLAKFGLDIRPFVLAVSSLAPHKNFQAVVRAVEQMGDISFDIAIAGGQNPKVFASGNQPLPASVKYVGYVSDAELKALYEHAACFVFPSIYEGYGLPPTEAMACGCPVLAADAASIPEVCGDAAVYFDPHQPASLAVALQRMMSDENLRRNLRELGLNRAAAMQWSHAVRALLNEIRRVAP